MDQQLAVTDGADDAPRARRLRPTVAAALSGDTGPHLLAGLLRVLAFDDLSARELVEVAVAWKRIISYATAGQLAAVADPDRALPSDGARRGGPVVTHLRGRGRHPGTLLRLPHAARAGPLAAGTRRRGRTSSGRAAPARS